MPPIRAPTINQPINQPVGHRICVHAPPSVPSPQSPAPIALAHAMSFLTLHMPSSLLNPQLAADSQAPSSTPGPFLSSILNQARHLNTVLSVSILNTRSSGTLCTPMNLGVSVKALVRIPPALEIKTRVWRPSMHPLRRHHNQPLWTDHIHQSGV